MHAYIFPGQGAQYPGMGKSLYDSQPELKKLFDEADQILGFKISEIMFHGSDEDLKQTKVTQPAIFIHSVAAYYSLSNPRPYMTAGHSLGEFSALVASKVLSFSDGLKLVSIRANAMQKACEANPSTMAAVLGLPDDVVETVCKRITDQTNETVVAANYNCPGQLVISGTLNGVEIACGQLKDAGAKRALILPVGGAFHSPLMEPAKEELATAIDKTHFDAPICPIYQNVVAAPVIEPAAIKQNLIDQLTGPVKWTQCIEAMVRDGATEFTECGPGKVLQGLTLKIYKDATVNGVN